MVQDDPLRDVLGMLSDEQIHALRTALARSAASSGRRVLSEEQLKSIRGEADTYREAQRKTAEAIGVLWNARLDLALRIGNVDSIEDALVRPIGDVAFYDNCNCGGGGGGTGYW
jgi:hypothetical protein